MAPVFITNITLYTGTDFAQSFVLEDYIDAFNIFSQRKAMGKVTLELKQE